MTTATTSVVTEGRTVGDLAQAIVALSRSAEKRRGARADLIDATDTIAKAIREQLRTGDSVKVERFPRDENRPELDLIEYEAVKVRRKSGAIAVGSEEDALARGLAILGLAEAQGPYLIVGWGTTNECHPATAQEREAFVQEAQQVTFEFSRLLTMQAITFEASAKKAAKLTPR